MFSIRDFYYYYLHSYTEDTIYFGGVRMTILYFILYFLWLSRIFVCVEQGKSNVQTQGATRVELIPLTKKIYFTLWYCLNFCLRSFFPIVASFLKEDRGKDQLFKLIFLDKKSIFGSSTCTQLSLEKIFISKKNTN